MLDHTSLYVVRTTRVEGSVGTLKDIEKVAHQFILHRHDGLPLTALKVKNRSKS